MYWGAQVFTELLTDSNSYLFKKIGFPSDRSERSLQVKFAWQWILFLSFGQEPWSVERFKAAGDLSSERE
jgi:hypothetical protein